MPDLEPQAPWKSAGARRWLVRALAGVALSYVWMALVVGAWIGVATMLHGSFAGSFEVRGRRDGGLLALLAAIGPGSAIVGVGIGGFVGPLWVGSGPGRPRRPLLASSACGAALGGAGAAMVAVVMVWGFIRDVYPSLIYVELTVMGSCVAAGGMGGVLGARLISRRPRPRFTLKRIMRTTAVVGLLLGALARLDRLQRVSARYQRIADGAASSETSMRNLAAQVARQARDGAALAAGFDRLAAISHRYEARVAAAGVASLLRRRGRRQRSEAPLYEGHVRFFEDMREKYREAAQRPWSPVEPDPPRPPLPGILPDDER